jgi:hypothetical protein
MMIDVLLGGVVLLNAWLLSARTTPLFPLGRLLARMRTTEHGNNVSTLMR